MGKFGAADVMSINLQATGRGRIAQLAQLCPPALAQYRQCRTRLRSFSQLCPQSTAYRREAAVNSAPRHVQERVSDPAFHWPPFLPAMAMGSPFAGKGSQFNHMVFKNIHD
jgi:hypothetical protein